MKTYRLVFTCQSVINQIPDSQTIFGFICNTINQLKGKEALDDYLHSFDNEPYFIHSSMFYNNLIPMIKRNIFSLGFTNEIIKKTEKQERIKTLDNLKKFKRISYVSERIYKEFIMDMETEALKKQIIEYPDKFKVENNILQFASEKIDFTTFKTILNTRNGFPEKGEDKSLFYENQCYFPIGTEFCIYVKSNQNIDYIVEIFKYLEIFGIGSRKSVGMNSFKFKKVEACSLQSSNHYKLILSKYIPYEDINYEKSCYQCISNMYKSNFHQKGINQLIGKFTHLTEGSLVYMNENKEFYGKIIKIGEDISSIYHYGIGFTF